MGICQAGKFASNLSRFCLVSCRLFEFIILIIDRQLHELTHGEVVSLLLIKIAIAAILSAIHHFLEKGH
jgi:hypothetical protein